jgi:hypothetical protein
MLSLFMVGAVGALFVVAFLVFRKWKSYTLPIRLVPLDILVIILLIDLNIKSLSNLTVEDTFMKLEALGFTGLLAFVLFAPVLWKLYRPKSEPEVPRASETQQGLDQG